MEGAPASTASPPVRSILYFLLTPLLGCHLYEPESLPKLLICAGAIVLLNGWILWGAREKSIPWPRGWMPRLALAFGLVTILQSLRAANVYLAVVELTLHLGGMTVALALASSAPMRAFLVRCLPPSALAAAIVLAAVGICQWNRFAPTACMWIGPWVPQVPSLFANGNYAGTFVAMLFPLVLAGTLLARTTPRLLAWSAATGLLSAYLMLSQSRAGMLAAVLTLAATVGMILFRRRSFERFGVKLGMFAGSGLLGVLLSTVSLSDEAPSTWTQHVTHTGSAAARIEIWKNSARVVASHPVFGAGAGNFRPAYHEARNPEELGPNALQDPNNGFFAMGNPHNTPLHLLAELGPWGLLPVAAIVGLAFARFWSRSAAAGADDAWLFAMAGVVLAFVIGGMFNSLSNRAVHMAYVWTALGYLLGESGGEPAAIRGGRLKAALVACAALAALFAAAGVVHFGAVVSRDLDVRFIVGGRKNAELADRAVRYHPWNFHQRLRYGNFFLEEGDLNRAEREFAAVHAWEPSNPYLLLKRGDVALRGGGTGEARSFYDRCLEAAPRWALPRLGLAQVAYHRGDVAGADAQLASLLEANPSWPEALLWQGLVRGSQGRHVEAAALFEKASAGGFPVRKALAGRPEPWLGRPEYGTGR